MRYAACMLTVLVAAFAPAAAHADTLTQTFSQTYSGLTGPEESTFGVALFDPALGTLNSVTQTLSGNIVFTPAITGAGSYTFNVNGNDTPIPGLITGYSTQDLDYSVTSNGPTLEESTDQFGQQYTIEPFDLEIEGGTLSSIGLISDTFTFNYTPASAATPEPSPYLLLGTGLLGALGLKRRRDAV